MSKVNFIITHKNCADGSVAAVIPMRCLNVPIEHVYPLGHFNSDSNLQTDYLNEKGFFTELGKHLKSEITLWVLDYTLEPALVLNLLENHVDTIITLDHHKSEEFKYTGNSKIKEYMDKGKLFHVFNTKWSGAGLTYMWFDFFYNNDDFTSTVKLDYKNPEHMEGFLNYINDELIQEEFRNSGNRLVRYVQHRDLWTWVDHKERDDIEAFSTIFLSECKSLEGVLTNFHPSEWLFSKSYILNVSLNKQIDNYIEQGRCVINYRNNLIDSSSKSYHETKLTYKYANGITATFNGRIINGPLALASDLCNRMITKENLDFCILYSICPKPDGKVVVECSIRSNKEMDCSKLAKFFGGGGHPQASGFKFNDVLQFVSVFNISEPNVELSITIL